MASHGHRHSRGRRNYNNNPKPSHKQNISDVDDSSEVIKVFREFQKELDIKNDKHERIVKLSRDITIESKRLIFLLHRINGSGSKNEVLEDAENKLEELHRSKFLPLADELKGHDSYQFLRAFSPGLQEYIEAVTFYYFLKDNELVGVEKIQEDIRSAISKVSEEKVVGVEASIVDSVTTPVTQDPISQQPLSSDHKTADKKANDVPIPLTEYMLGIADFTGELMRMAINSVGAGDLDTPKEVTDLMRTIHNAFSSFSNAPRELRRKATVLRQSLQKVENACYNLRVRGSEIPKHMLADVFTTAHSTMPDDPFLGDTEEILS